MEPTNGGEYIAVAAKASPPLTVTGMTLGGIGLQEWVLVLTALYTVLQIAALVWGWIKKNNGSK